MKKLLFLCIIVIFVFVSLFCWPPSICFSVDYGTIQKHLDRALKLKESGDIEGATMFVQLALSVGFLAKELRPEIDDEEIYTKEYLKALIKCLNADVATYIAIVKHTTSVAKKTKEVFSRIVEELKTEEISAENALSVKMMSLEMSREIITHSFCVPPKGYKEVYDAIQITLFWYSKAWRGIDSFVHEKSSERTELKAEALLSFQRGNKAFSQAGSLMLEISKR